MHSFLKFCFYYDAASPDGSHTQDLVAANVPCLSHHGRPSKTNRTGTVKGAFALAEKATGRVQEKPDSL